MLTRDQLSLEVWNTMLQRYQKTNSNVTLSRTNIFSQTNNDTSEYCIYIITRCLFQKRIIFHEVFQK